MKMACCILLVAVVEGVAWSQANDRLDLSIEKPEYRYCVSDERFGAIQVKGEFHFRNSTNHVVYLMRQATDVQYIKMRPLAKTQAAENEYTASISSVLGGLDDEIHVQPKDLIRLLPGGDYVEANSFVLPFRKARAASEGKVVADGIYSLSVKVSVWPSAKRPTLELENSLSDGQIWIQPLWSTPIRLQIRLDSAQQSCTYP